MDLQFASGSENRFQEYEVGNIEMADRHSRGLARSRIWRNVCMIDLAPSGTCD
jgi:hypothetical protein